MPRLALAALVAVALFWVTCTQGIAYLRADVAAAQAYRSADSQEALALMGRAVELAPGVSLYYQYRADMLADRMDATEDAERHAALAEEVYVERALAVQADPLSAEARLGLAAASLELARLGYEGMGEQAATLYRSLVDTVPAVPQLQTQFMAGLAMSHIEGGRFHEALRVLDSLLSLEPAPSERANALYLRGVAYQELGRVQEATASLEESLDYDGRQVVRAEAHRLLAELYARSGDDALARQHARRYRELVLEGQ